MKDNGSAFAKIVLSFGAASLLMLGAGLCSGYKPETSWAVSSSTMVMLPAERIMQASVAVADFDGDGTKEIVTGAKDGMLYVIAYDGSSWSVVWSRQTLADLFAAGAPNECAVTDRTEIRSAAAIADIDNDGNLEIVVAVGGNPGQHRHGGALVYSYDRAWSYSMLAGWPQPRIDEVGGGVGIREPDGCWDGTAASPALGDLDGDGDLEVVIQALNRRIYAWHHDGSAVSGWPIRRENGDNLLRGGESTPALGDIDGDGLPEVVIGTNSPPWDGIAAPDYSKGTVWAINGDSSPVNGWPVATDNNILSSVALGDIDKDGQLEVIVGSAVSREGGTGRRVYAWNSDGSVVQGWPKTTAGDMPSSPALGDLDGDGDLEIVIGCGVEDDPTHCTYLYAWHDDGSLVSGFPMSPPSNDPDSSDASGLPYSPVLADYDGDGLVEILVVNWRAGGVSTVESDGTANNDPSMQTVSGLFNSPLVDDLDNDGKLEIVIGGATPGETRGAVYIWDVDGDADAAQPWPMFHRDVYRSGNASFYIDNTPPQNPLLASSTHIPGVWSITNQVRMEWSGTNDEESGIDGYFYRWDTSASTVVDEHASWLDSSRDSLVTELDDGANWYFHIRAVNRAKLLANDTVHFGPVEIDTTPPMSAVSAPACAVISATVSWSGNDTGSGIVDYRVQTRAEGTGVWEDWHTGTAQLSDAYANTTGRVYEFRSLARDGVGNWEVKSDAYYDAQTLLTEYGLSGSVYNGRGDPVYLAEVTALPPVSLTVSTDLHGSYQLCYQAAVTHTVTASRSGFGSLPATQNLSGTLKGLDFFLAPLDDSLVNGQFETGDLTGWKAENTPSAAVVVTGTAHSGSYAVALQSIPPDRMAALSQSVFISETLKDPALSLVYRTSGADSMQVAVQSSSRTLSRTLSGSGDPWSHEWLDLTALKGQTVTVTLELDGSSGQTSWFVIDEVSMGSIVPGLGRIYLPVVLRQ